MKLIDLITAQSAASNRRAFRSGHGTTNAFDEAAWLVLFALGLPLDALEERAQRELPADDQAKAEALVTQRIETRRPWPLPDAGGLAAERALLCRRALHRAALLHRRTARRCRRRAHSTPG